MEISKGNKDGRLKDIIQEFAAKFIQRESNYTSLITVTDVVLADRGRRATIFFTVLPTGTATGADMAMTAAELRESKEKAALDFMKRKRTEFRDYIQENSRLARIPFFDFEIDIGEKNRQKIDEISQNV